MKKIVFLLLLFTTSAELFSAEAWFGDQDNVVEMEEIKVEPQPPLSQGQIDQYKAMLNQEAQKEEQRLAEMSAQRALSDRQAAHQRRLKEKEMIEKLFQKEVEKLFEETQKIEKEKLKTKFNKVLKSTDLELKKLESLKDAKAPGRIKNIPGLHHFNSRERVNYETIANDIPDNTTGLKHLNELKTKIEDSEINEKFEERKKRVHDFVEELYQHFRSLKEETKELVERIARKDDDHALIQVLENKILCTKCKKKFSKWEEGEKEYKNIRDHLNSENGINCLLEYKEAEELPPK